MSVLSKKTGLRVTLFSVLFGVLSHAPLWAIDTAKFDAGAPERSSGLTLAVSKEAKRYMSVTANPLATEAADKILKMGGSAVDAAIAAQLVLGLVEPQSSGIAGGALLLSFDGKKLRYYDGREVAPAGVKPDLFQTVSNGKKIELPFYEAVIGGRSVGV
ncbi:MAG: gamma-glutamyltransferase, partial [Neisseriaceae bacterium]|nr:gamma-glutamyltransferase [Neisseriaceae bacterium]